MTSKLISALMGSAIALTTFGMAHAQEVNVYSSRHYDSDDGLYEAFTAATGITVNRIEAEADELIARMQAEGANSPADVYLTVDAGRIWRADQLGLLQPIDSATLEERIPAHLRHPDGHWFGLSMRARAIFYDKADVANPPQSYEDLADPQYAGQICIRSASNIYNQSLMASIIEANGEEAAAAWAEGFLANLAREPEGGDTDQLRAIVSGQCDIAVSNTYYYLRALTSDVEGLTGSTDMLGYVFPNQDGRGTHVNVAAAGVAVNAPNRDNAIALIEFLATDEAQQFFANQNNEYPVVPSVPAADAVLAMGEFKQDEINLTILGERAARGQEIFNAAGWK